MFEDKSQLARLRKTFTEYAEDCGVVGGMVVIHPWRGRKNVMDAIRTKTNTPKKAYHVHIIGLRIPQGWEKSDDFYDRTGWVYKWVDEYTQRGHKRSMYSKILYELNHAGIPITGKKPGQIDTWVGICSRNSVKRTKEETHEPVICKVCQLQAHRYIHDETEDSGPTEHKVTTYHHNILPSAIERARKRYTLPQGPELHETLEGVLKDVKITEV